MRRLLVCVLPFALASNLLSTPEEDAMSRCEEMVVTFQRAARLDHRAALRLLGMPGLEDRWGQRMRGLFEDSLESSAFFSHCVMVIYPRHAGAFIAGFGHIWTGILLLVRFDAGPRGLRIADFAVLDARGAGAATNDWRIVGADMVGLEGAIRQRWKEAEATFANAARAMASGSMGEALEKSGGGLSASEAAARSKEHVAHSRALLSPEVGQEREPLRNALEMVASRLEEDRPSAAGDPLAPLKAYPVEWRQQLQPVFGVPRLDGSAIVVLAASKEPDHLVLFDIRPADVGRELSEARLCVIEGGKGP